MIDDTRLVHTNETLRIEAFYNTLKLVGGMDVTPLRDENWFDDPYTAEHGPEYEVPPDESWLDDLDEAA